MRTTSTRLFLMAAAVALMTACASAMSGAGAESRNVITASDLAGTNAQTAYEAVRILRPDWLSSRGPTSLTNSSPNSVTVYVNGVEVGDAEYLRNVSVLDITELRYYEPGTAAARFGMGHQRGVIELKLKGSGR
ncbi:MAG TPA: hypothetical protein VF188_16340 [Longimicrobiales bacterium]